MIIGNKKCASNLVIVSSTTRGLGVSFPFTSSFVQVTILNKLLNGACIAQSKLTLLKQQKKPMVHFWAVSESPFSTVS